MISIYEVKTLSDTKEGAPQVNVLPLSNVENKAMNLSGWDITVTLPIKYKKHLQQGFIVESPTKSDGNQYFIINNIEYDKNNVTFTAYHEIYSMKDYLVEELKLTNVNISFALTKLFENTDRPNPFTISGSSTIIISLDVFAQDLLTIIQEIVAQGEITVRPSGTNLLLSNESGIDTYQRIARGSNLYNFTYRENFDHVVTRVYPFFQIGDDRITLPEKYIDSQFQYNKVYVKAIQYEPTIELREEPVVDEDGKKEENPPLRLNDLIVNLREQATKSLLGTQFPKISYKVSSTLQVDFRVGDIVHFAHPDLTKAMPLDTPFGVQVDKEDLTIPLPVYSYEYDLLANSLKAITYGDLDTSPSKSIGDFATEIVLDKTRPITDYIIKAKDIQDRLDIVNENIQTDLKHQQEQLDEQAEVIGSLNKNGHLIIYENELFAVDTLPIASATNVLNLGQGGITFSNNGINGPFTAAIGIDGKINANQILTGELDAAIIKTNTIRGDALTLEAKESIIAMTNGRFEALENRKVGGVNYLQGSELVEVIENETFTLVPLERPIEGEVIISIGGITQHLNTNSMTQVRISFRDNGPDTGNGILNTYINIATLESQVVTLPSPCHKILIYSGDTPTNSKPNHFEFREVMLEKGNVRTDWDNSTTDLKVYVQGETQTVRQQLEDSFNDTITTTTQTLVNDMDNIGYYPSNLADSATILNKTIGTDLDPQTIVPSQDHIVYVIPVDEGQVYKIMRKEVVEDKPFRAIFTTTMPTQTSTEQGIELVDASDSTSIDDIIVPKDVSYLVIEAPIGLYVEHIPCDDFSCFTKYAGTQATINKTYPIDVFNGGKNYLLNSGEKVDFEEQDVIPTTVGGYLPTEGGKNLLLRSGEYTTNANYYVRGYTPTEPMVAGETYTATIKMKLPAEVSYIQLYVSDGYQSLATIRNNKTGEMSEYKVTFVSKYHKDRTPQDNIVNAVVSVFRFPNVADMPNVEIENIKIEKGDIATDWTPAPEDFNSLKGKSYALSQLLHNENTLSLNGSFEEDDFIGLWLGNDKFVGFLDNQKLTFDLGGRNYVVNSAVFERGLVASGITPTTNGNILEVLSEKGNGNWHTGWFSNLDNLNFSHLENSFQDGEIFTVSITARGVGETTGKPSIYIKPGMGYYSMTGEISENWSKLYYTGKWKKEKKIEPHFGWYNAVGTFQIKNWKIEKGDIATDWTPAPEDFNDPEFVVKTLSEKGIIDNAKLEKGSVATEWSPNPQDGYGYNGANPSYHIQTTGGTTEIKLLHSVVNFGNEDFNAKIKIKNFGNTIANYWNRSDVPYIYTQNNERADISVDGKVVTLPPNNSLIWQIRGMSVSDELDFIACDASIKTRNYDPNDPPFEYSGESQGIRVLRRKIDSIESQVLEIRQEQIKQTVDIDGLRIEYNSKIYGDPNVPGDTGIDGFISKYNSWITFELGNESTPPSMNMGHSNSDVKMKLTNDRLSFESDANEAAFTHWGMYTTAWYNPQHMIKAFESNGITGTLWVDVGTDI